MPKPVSMPERCRDPECGARLVAHTAPVVPPGHARHGGRGLCKASRGRAQRAGVLDRYPPLIHDPGAVVEAFWPLRIRGLTLRQIAGELGVTYGSLRGVLARAGITRTVPAEWADPDLFDPNASDEGED